MIYSERTYELDAQATVSALKDVIERKVDAAQLHQHMDLIRRANDRPVEANQAREMLRKALQKHEADSVVEAFESRHMLLLAGMSSIRHEQHRQRRFSLVFGQG